MLGDQKMDRVNRPNEHLLLVCHTLEDVFFTWVGHRPVAEDEKESIYITIPHWKHTETAYINQSCVDVPYVNLAYFHGIDYQRR